MKYEVLTKRSVYSDENNSDEYIEALVDEQREVLKSLGYSLSGVYTICNYDFSNISAGSYYDLLDGLAIKDGADLVRFDNGMVGFVGYYNGIKVENNHFCFVGGKQVTENCEVLNDTIFVTYDDLSWALKFDDVSKIKEACDIIEKSIDLWADDEDYYSWCIGDIIEEQLTESGMEGIYKFID